METSLPLGPHFNSLPWAPSFLWAALRMYTTLHTFTHKCTYTQSHTYTHTYTHLDSRQQYSDALLSHGNDHHIVEHLCLANDDIHTHVQIKMLTNTQCKDRIKPLAVACMVTSSQLRPVHYSGQSVCSDSLRTL